MTAAPPSAGRRGLTLAGGSRSSRPLVKAAGGCIRRGRGRRKEVILYTASTSAKVNSDYARTYGTIGRLNMRQQIEDSQQQKERSSEA